MNTGKSGKYFYYLISLLILITGLFGIKRLISKADLPFSYSFENDNLISQEYYETIYTGDTILSVDDIKIYSLYQLETILDSKSIGDDANIEIITDRGTYSKPNIHLTRYYGNLDFIIISFFVGLSFWLSAVFLIIKKYGERSVTVLFWVLVLFSLATMTSPGRYFSGNDWIAFFVRTSHVASYFLGAIVFLHFTFIFPRVRVKSLNIIFSILYLLSFLFCILLITAQLKSISDHSSGWIFTMEKLWGITEIVLLISITGGALNLYLYYRKIINRPERKKTEWVFWGLAVGVCPFLLLWLLPRLLGFTEIIREEILLAFMIFVPVFFSMAVVKYHIFEIDILIKRSILYSALTLITVIIYFSVVFLIAFFANDIMIEYRNLVSLFLILLIAFIFNPLQIKLRNFIDKIFYRENYNFEKTVTSFSEGIKDQSTISGLSKYVIDEFQKIIPVTKIALIAGSASEEKFTILSQNNFDNIREFTFTLKISDFRTYPVRILSQKDKAEPAISTDKSLSDFLKKWGVNIVFPFIPEPADTAGLILLGDKLSGLGYTNRDVELLKVLISNISLAFKKLQLQRKLMLEEMEVSRLEQINKMMTYYVSSVSHDLKTPLTSIKMFAEILREQNSFANENSKEYLDIIEGESDRLSRLINNVLNYSRIENGIKEYSFGKVNLNECIEDVLKIMEYQFVKDNFKIGKSLQGNIYINADIDAVKEVLINLLSNSIKYSPGNKIIRISSKIKNGFAVVKIEDEGIGIQRKDLKNIFKPFVRSKRSNVHHTGGAGIGLSIVKNIMDVHKGRIDVVSEIDKGSCFILYFSMAG